MTVAQRPPTRRFAQPLWLRTSLGRVLAVVLLATFAAAVVAGLRMYEERAPLSSRDVVAVQLAGGPSQAAELVCEPNGAPTRRDRCASIADLRGSLDAESWLLLGYGGLAGICLTGGLLFAGVRGRRIGLLAAVGTTLAVGLDAAENALTRRGLDALEAGIPSAAWPWVSATAGAKFVLLLVAGAVGACTLLVVGSRALIRPTDYSWVVRGRGQEAPNVYPPPATCTSTGLRVPATGLPVTSYADLGRPPGDIGICVSGGGIRSATSTLGLLQVLQERRLLQRARYLVSVSGGGYVVGALRLAVQPRSAADPVVLDPTEPAPFAAGSPEVDHLRRHGRYLADSFLEWAVAAAVLLRGVFVSLFLLAGAVTALGLLLGAFYRVAPVADLQALIAGGDLPDGVTAGGALATGTLLVAAVTIWLINVVAHQWRGRSVRWLLRLAFAVTSLAGLSLLVTMGVPALVWGAERLQADVATPGAVGTGISAVTASYVGALVTMLWRHRTVAGRLRTLLGGGSDPASSRIPSGIVPQLVVSAVLLLLGVLFLALLAQVVAAAVPERGRAFLLYPAQPTEWLALGMALAAVGLLLFAAVGASPTHVALPRAVRVAAGVASVGLAVVLAVGPGVVGSGSDALVERWTRADAQLWPHVWLFVTPATFLLAAWLLDQTWSSLHPFYRRRLATAFAVRRVRLDDGQLAAEPYDFDTEPTSLSTHATPVEGLPQVVFAAAANLSGADRTPPGRRATSFTFSHDWIGGPEVGYVATRPLEQHLTGAVSSDLSVQSAVAISGAAFASAMGRQARAVQTLLAISNARLGTWLPNPAWLASRDQRNDWLSPRLPNVRRITSLLREVLGSYSPTERLLLVTDGGHYENLGLVELLRHRCRTVVCLDASGDAPPATQVLAEAITLAREELGVEIVLDDPFSLTPGGGPPLQPESSLEALSARLSAACVAVGTVTYPEPFTVAGESGPSRTGRIVVAKLRLTAEMPYDVLTYAQQNRAFPYDSTGDQWFEQSQFDAYLALGRHLGEEVAERLTQPAAPADSLPGPRGAGGAGVPVS